MKVHNAYILRSTLGDCTNNGVTSRQKDIYLFSGGTTEEIQAYADDHHIAYELCFQIEVIRKGQSNEYRRAVPAFTRGKWWMSGGNYAYSCDSRYREVTGIPYPISVHDRTEDADEYLTND